MRNRLPIAFLIRLLPAYPDSRSCHRLTERLKSMLPSLSVVGATKDAAHPFVTAPFQLERPR
jgi:hypothetical protein